MEELFAPPGNTWRAVSPALARMRRTVLVAALVVLLVADVVLAFVLPVPTWASLAGGLLVVAAAGVGWVLIGRNARRWGYAERDEDLYIKRGALFRKLVVVPYGRMQYVDVEAGPLDRAYGIATVHLHTASPATTARIPGLPAQEASRLRDRLTSLGEAQAAGL